MKAPVRLTRTPAYLARKATLSAERRLSLELIEQGIAADPHGLFKRRAGPGDTVVDYSEHGLYVTFHLVDERTAELVDFLDLLASA